MVGQIAMAYRNVTTCTVPPSKNVAVVPAPLRIIQSCESVLDPNDDVGDPLVPSITCRLQHN